MSYGAEGAPPGQRVPRSVGRRLAGPTGCFTLGSDSHETSSQFLANVAMATNTKVELASDSCSGRLARVPG
jgi:hypothetical protein